MTPLSIGKPGNFYYDNSPPPSIFTNILGGIISDTTLNDILRISKCCGFKPLNFLPVVFHSAVCCCWWMKSSPASHFTVNPKLNAWPFIQWVYGALHVWSSLWVTANIPLNDAFSEERSSWNFTNSLPGRIEILIVFTESRLSTWQLQHV